MQQGSSKKVATLVLVLMTLVLIGIGVAIFLQLQKSKSGDVSVYGFGEVAVRDQFNDVSETFASIPCIEYINRREMAGSSNAPTAKLADDNTMKVADGGLPDSNNYAKQCLISVGKGKSISFKVKGYKYDSFIDPNREALFERINGVVLNTPALDSGEYERINYFFGTNKTYPNVCSTTLFHYQNDFEFAQIDYQGFNCSDIIELNKGISNIFMEKILLVMLQYQISDAVLEELDPENYPLDPATTN